MTDYATFVEGGVSFPLDTVSANTLLKDADPAVHYALDFLATVLQTHVGARLQQEAAKFQVKIENAVNQRISVEPSPFLYNNQLRFPLLAMYRKTDAVADHTTIIEKATSTLEVVWCLPLMHGLQVDTINPILHAGARAMTRAMRKMFDPAYASGANVWDLMGVQKAGFTDFKYGGFEALTENSDIIRAVIGTLVLVEQDNLAEEANDFEALGSIGLEVGVNDSDADPLVTDDVEVDTTF